MKMANHPRPGDIIQESLDELNVSLREFARAMEIAPSTASRLLTGKAALTPEMAIKLSVVIGSSPQMWLNLQNAWSLAEAEKTVDVSRLRRLVRNKKWHLIKRHLKLMTNATLPDALRLSAYTFTAIYWI
ncbi:putative plasmid maintenance protein [Escherichia coli]|nr:putative plasmid maintenance protein [Escherichia coli]